MFQSLPYDQRRSNFHSKNQSQIGGFSSQFNIDQQQYPYPYQQLQQPPFQQEQQPNILSQTQPLFQNQSQINQVYPQQQSLLLQQQNYQPSSMLNQQLPYEQQPQQNINYLSRQNYQPFDNYQQQVQYQDTSLTGRNVNYNFSNQNIQQNQQYKNQLVDENNPQQQNINPFSEKKYMQSYYPEQNIQQQQNLPYQSQLYSPPKYFNYSQQQKSLSQQPQIPILNYPSEGFSKLLSADSYKLKTESDHFYNYYISKINQQLQQQLHEENEGYTTIMALYPNNTKQIQQSQKKEYFIQQQQQQVNQNNALFLIVKSQGCCSTYCLPQDCMAFKINIHHINSQNEGQIFLQMIRECSLTCCCIGRPDVMIKYCEEGMHQQHILGYIQNQFSFLNYEIKILDDYRNLLYTISAECCNWGVWCPLPLCDACQESSWVIKNKLGQTVTKFQRIVNHSQISDEKNLQMLEPQQNFQNFIQQQQFLKQSQPYLEVPEENFIINFQQFQNDIERALLFAGVLYIEFRYLSQKKPRQNQFQQQQILPMLQQQKQNLNLSQLQ